MARWEGHIVENSTVNWWNAYYLPFLCTGETKLRVFQYKFLHRRIATNDFLCKIGIKQVDSCSFCGESTETLVHLFWNCKYTQAFWKITCDQASFLFFVSTPKKRRDVWSQVIWKKVLEWMFQKIVNLKDSVFSPFLCLGLVEMYQMYFYTTCSLLLGITYIPVN